MSRDLLLNSDFEEQKDKKIKERIKELWKRPGGTFAKVSGILAIGAVGFGLYKALPFLITLASNTIWFVVEMVVLAILLYVVTSKQFRRGIQLLWLQISRWFIGLIVEMDPINILKNGISEMKQNESKVHKAVTDLEAILVSMKKKLTEYQKEFDSNKSRAEIADKKLRDPRTDDETKSSLASTLKLLARSIVRGEEQISKQKTRIETSSKYLDIMKRLEKMVEFHVKDAEEQLKYTQDDYEQAKAQASAMKSINSILRGGLTKSMEEELALDNVNSTINESIAEMNRLLDGSNDLLINFDLDSEASLEKANEILKAIDEGKFNILKENKTKSKKEYFTDYVELPNENNLPKRRWT